MRNPAQVLEAASQILPKGAFQRITARRQAWVREFPHDPEVSWWVDEPLRNACFDEAVGPYLRIKQGHDVDSMQLIAALPVLAQWRLTRGMYEFDQTLTESFLEDDLDTVPVEALRFLPEYAPYIRFNRRYAGILFIGAWLSISIDESLKPLRLNGVLHAENGAIHVIEFHFGGRNTIKDCMTATLQYINQTDDVDKLRLLTEEEDANFIRFLLCHLLYLASEEPDIQGEPREPKFHKKKNLKDVAIPPQTDNMLMVGYRHGGAIRKWAEQNSRQSDSSGAGMPKAPHVRRGHFRTYWTGKGRKIPRVRWIKARGINIKDFDDVATHSRPVMDDPANAR